MGTWVLKAWEQTTTPRGTFELLEAKISIFTPLVALKPGAQVKNLHLFIPGALVQLTSCCVQRTTP